VADAAGEPVVATPALALVAAASVLCGYRWLGVFPSGDTRLSALAFGRWGALTFAVLAGTVAVVATRAAGRRRTTGRGWMVGSAGLLLVTAAALVIHADTATRYAVGVSALVMASTAGGALLADERRRRRAARRPPGRPSPDGPAHRPLPVA
jgi:hypothetical protein